MSKSILSILAASATIALSSCSHYPVTVNGGSELITFAGRTDLSNPDAPKQWAAGGYFTFGFEGNFCIIGINDECAGGQNRNIVEVVVDDNSTVIRTKGVRNRIVIGVKSMAEELTANADTALSVFFCELDPSVKEHHVTVCRDTETAMGFTQLSTVSADKLFKWTPGDKLNIEFIGNSITCGAEADTTFKARSEYQWGDWHRAYVGYAPRTARALEAQYSLVSVSGIGLIRSCCDMGITMPDVYDKIVLRDNKIGYDFAFKPDLICCCLGQNDGIQDSTAFCSAYVDFIKVVKERNPQAKHIVLLSSPMDNGDLSAWLHRMLPSVADKLTQEGVENVSCFFYSKAWNAGGADHPSVEEHEEIAAELTAYLKTIL